MPLELFDLKTAISMSLLTDRRVDNPELPQGETYKRGWWGDCLNESENKTGSKLWLLHRKKFDQEAIELAKAYTLEALDWLIQDEITDTIDVQCEILDHKTLLIHVIVHLIQSDPSIQFQVELPQSKVTYAF